MHLIIGGRSQGQTEYAKGLINNPVVVDLAETDFNTDCDIIVNLHLGIRKMLENGENPVDTIKNSIHEMNEMIISGDEIGSGIVPMEAFDREWRDETGRVYTLLANHAHTVERIWAGCVQRLKGKDE